MKKRWIKAVSALLLTAALICGGAITPSYALSDAEKAEQLVRKLLEYDPDAVFDGIIEKPTYSGWYLARAHFALVSCADVDVRADNYILHGEDIKYPSAVGWLLASPATGQCVTLETALDFGIMTDAEFEQFAEDNADTVGFTYYGAGDADGDGAVNIADVTAIQRVAAGFEPGMKDVFYDFNRDGAIDVTDATQLQMDIAGSEYLPHTADVPFEKAFGVVFDGVYSTDGEQLYRHDDIRLVSSRAELDAYLDSLLSKLGFGDDGDPARLREGLALYDDTFFEDTSLLLLGRYDACGNGKLTLDSLGTDGHTLYAKLSHYESICCPPMDILIFHAYAVQKATIGDARRLSVRREVFLAADQYAAE